MGVERHMPMSPETTKKSKCELLQHVPVEKPPFTLGDIKKVIPPHCFNRSVLRSFSYVVSDLATVFLLYYVASNYFHLLPFPFSFLAWPLYWIVQGCVFIGVWMLGHECGHRAFSDYQWLDNTVGLILHSALLTPYFSWKYTHRRHHSNTGSLEYDEVVVPMKKTDISQSYKYIDNPLGTAIFIFIMFTFGWPFYLMFNMFHGRSYDRFASHFFPYSPMYTDRERLQIYISDASVLAVAYGLYRLVVAKGLAWVFYLYGVPLLVMNGLFVVITYLHHTHPSLPHYDSSEWDWLRGGLSTVDRDYGMLNKVFHNITDTHVVHHLFSTMPHYHAIEATKAIQPILGDYYNYDRTPILKALWREVKTCIYVEPDERGQNIGVLWFNNKL